MELEEAIKKLKLIKWQYEKPLQHTTGETFFDERQAIDIVLKELESLQITNELLYKTNKDLIEKQMPIGKTMQNIGKIELLGNEKWSIE